MNNSVNARILIIDDEPIVRDTIKEILAPPKKENNRLLVAAGDLFDDPEPVIRENPRSLHPVFELDEANNGKVGLEKVIESLISGKPYAVILLDMRMPDWDGLETCIKIRKIDPKVQIYFITAHSDRSVYEIIRQAGADVGYLAKPFQVEEILQIATKGIYDWDRLTSLENLLELIGQIGIGDSQLPTLLVNIFHQIASYVGTQNALLGQMDEQGTFHVISRIGAGKSLIDTELFFKRNNLKQFSQATMINEILLCPMNNYCILAIPNDDHSFNQERAYLLRLFIENAVRAISNSELKEKLLRQEKLSAVGQAVSMVMHDIKNPMVNIQNLARMIKEEVREDPLPYQMSVMLEKTSTRAWELVSDINDFVRNANLSLETVEAATFFKEIEQELMLNNPVDEQILKFESEDGLNLVCDPRKLRRVIINLVRNAQEAMESMEISNQEIQVRTEKQPTGIAIRVSDTGPGIPAKIRDHLFDPFVTSGKSNGTGLGLAIAKQIVDAHQGKISVDSSSEGTIFTISIPYS